MNKEKLISSLQRDLKTCVDWQYSQNFQNFFREPVRFYGVRSPLVKKLASQYYLQLKALSKEEIFETCEQLLKVKYYELSSIAFNFSFRQKNKFTISDFKVFENWIKNYVSNWAFCDDLCTHSLGYLVYQYPQLVTKTNFWLTSQNRWLKRAAAVTLIYGLRKSKARQFQVFLQRAFKVADTLLMDEDDLVQKAYGWALKEASNRDSKAVFNYVMEKKDVMPRTALRYAIEKMPLALKRQAMIK